MAVPLRFEAGWRSFEQLADPKLFPAAHWPSMRRATLCDDMWRFVAVRSASCLLASTDHLLLDQWVDGAPLCVQELLNGNAGLLQDSVQRSLFDSLATVAGHFRHGGRGTVPQDDVASLAMIFIESQALQPPNNLSTR